MIRVPDFEQAGSIPSGLSLPLVAGTALGGDGGFGASAPSFLPIAEGIVVSRKGVLSYHAPDLTREIWRREVNGWSRALARVGDNFVHGPVGDSLTVYSPETGQVQRAIACTGLNVLEAVADDGGWYLLWKREGLVAIDDRARQLWERVSTPSHCVVAGGLVLLTEKLDRQLVAVDRATGTERWHFEAPPEGDGEAGRRSQLIPAGFPSVTVVGDRVIVLTMNLRVFILSLETGGVIAQAKPPYPGWYLVTKKSIFFKQAFGLSEFDHRELKELNRIEYKADVEPMYKGRQATVNAFCLTEESVIWTTMHGTLMGVNRNQSCGGKRVTWCHDIPGAVMPLAEPPVAHGRFLYFTNKGQRLELLCFRSAAAR